MEHIHTDGNQYELYEYVWASAFYEKRHEAIFIQIKFMQWYFTSEYSVYDTEIHLPIYVDMYFYSDKFMQWYFTFEYSVYETEIHLPRYIYIFFLNA